MASLTVAVIVTADAVLLTEARHKVRQSLSIGARKKRAVVVTLAIAGYEVRKFLFKKWHKYCG